MQGKERSYFKNAIGIIGTAVMEGRFVFDDAAGIVENIMTEREKERLKRKYPYGGNIHEFATREMQKLDQPVEKHSRSQMPTVEDAATLAVIGVGIVALSGVTLVQGVKEKVRSHKSNITDTQPKPHRHNWFSLT